jgi:ADP-ribose pyrophosphatase YjhB (NUDIX family)
LKIFHDEAELSAWLAEKGIDTSKWGIGTAKTVTDLWQELANGDVYIQDDPPLRVVQVTEVVVRKADQVLIEAEQEFGNQHRRFRNRFPSEKMRSGENVQMAALRCLQEELGVEPADVTFLDVPLKQIKQVKESPSYPGLSTQYTFYRVETAVSELPSSDFWRDNKAFGHGDPVRRHRWAWRKVS